MIPSGSLTIERRGLDKYRRTLAHVYVAGSPVADVMIGEGFARAYDGGKRLPWCKP